MKFIDTHTHIFDEAFDIDRELAILRAKEVGVMAILLPDVDSTTNERLWSLVSHFPNYCFPMAGLHPSSVKEDYIDQLNNVDQIRQTRKIFGIGEIGIDLYWDTSFHKEQLIAFQQQLEWASQMNLPVSVHQRNAMEETLSVLKDFKGKVRGIMHCFSGDQNQAKRALDLGYFLGIGGVLTFKKSNLPEIIQFAGIENLVLETDAPWLAPVPHRGKRNEPSYLPLIIEKISSELSIDIEWAAEILYNNSKALFNLPIE